MWNAWWFYFVWGLISGQMGKARPILALALGISSCLRTGNQLSNQVIFKLESDDLRPTLCRQPIWLPRTIHSATTHYIDWTMSLSLHVRHLATLMLHDSTQYVSVSAWVYVNFDFCNYFHTTQLEARSAFQKASPLMVMRLFLNLQAFLHCHCLQCVSLSFLILFLGPIYLRIHDGAN